jgi:MFS transporter, DHA1 family, multidrug resistance protein
MFLDMEIQWAFTLLGCVALLLCPVPVFFYYYGAKLREKSKFAPTFSAQAPPSDDGESEDLDNEKGKEKEGEEVS